MLCLCVILLYVIVIEYSEGDSGFLHKIIKFEIDCQYGREAGMVILSVCCVRALFIGKVF